MWDITQFKLILYCKVSVKQIIVKKKNFFNILNVLNLGPLMTISLNQITLKYN